jgi:protein-disulfide isomerase
VDTGKVQFVYRSMGNFVSQNIGGGRTESQDAALASYCAADQGKFWEMQDALYANVLGEDIGSFTDRRLQAIAKKVGLDMTEFNSCYNSNKFADQVQQDLTDGTAAGITGTPGFLITYTANGETKTKTLSGAQPFSTFQQELEAILVEIGAQ